MLKSIDHVVIVVHDLDKASADFAAMGFTVVRGGEHTGGVTHNALVAFEDGSYLELVAFLDAPPDGHPFYRKHGEEGLVTFALLPDDIIGDVAAAERRGLNLDGPRRGGRTRPDGVKIEWETAWPRTRDLPFFCAECDGQGLESAARAGAIAREWGEGDCGSDCSGSRPTGERGAIRGAARCYTAAHRGRCGRINGGLQDWRGR